ncbi:MAG: right-handed parallel beta-helix repeat-containing protein, partial [Actinobacteria bacterium]|nr:right-handed parallel beta-helix repeat-containing protein [Actinomycetota bacterium]
NTGHGIMLHRSVTKSVVENNTVTANTDTGIVLFESFENRVAGNTVTGNLRGIRLSVGSANNVIEGNTFARNTSYGIYLYKGSDAPVSGDGRPKFNRFVANQIRDNGSYAVRAIDSDDNVFDGNVFSGNKGGILFEHSFRNQVINSTPADIQVETR